MIPIERPAARVLLVDGAGRTLLFRGGDPARPGARWWFTPGGGLNPGESDRQGAARELLEETGLRVDPADLGEPIWHQVTEFSYDHRRYRQAQHFFAYRVDEWQVDTTGFDVEERRTVDQHRWWSAAELDATQETVYPAELSLLLRRWLGSAAGGDPTIGVPRGDLRC